MLRVVWQALNCLSIHACGLRYVKTAIFCTCGSNNWETVEHRWVHAARQFVSIEFSFQHQILFPSIQHLAWLPQGRPQGKQKCGKNSDSCTYALTSASYNSETIEDRYILRGVWQALNCVSIHATYCVIVAGASPGETKMWAAVRENGDFFTFVDHVKTNKRMFEFFHHRVPTPF